MTKVTSNMRCAIFCIAYLSLTAAALGSGQAVPSAGSSERSVASATASDHAAESLYRQLCNVGLDKARVFQVRETSFDRAAFHVTLEDGIIAFTEDVAGRVTGAFFEGYGEILLAPPDRAERGSMALFTGGAILEERFATAYFRFNDRTFAELQPTLRPAENAAEFASRWNETAHNLAQGDGLRLLMSFSRFLPIPGQPPEPVGDESQDDRFLHARVQGLKLGTFDLYFDTTVPEQIWAGQFKAVKGDSYYDVWTLFSPSSLATHENNLTSVVGEEGKSDKIKILDYKIDTEVRPPTELNVDARLEMEVRQGGQRAVLFELSRFLHLKGVKAGERDLEFIHNPSLEGTQLSRRGNDLVAVIFPRSLETGQKIQLRFRYAGDVLSEAGGGLLYVGARGTWYPNRGLAMSNFDLRFHCPPGWTLVATGKRQDASTAGPAEASVTAPSPIGAQVTRWVSDGPIPLAGFNLGKYSRAAARAGNVLVESYAATGMERAFPKGEQEDVDPVPILPGLRRTPRAVVTAPLEPSPARNAQAVAEASARAVDFFAERFGPYPYGQLALTQMPGALSQGWPGLIFLSSFSFLTSAQKSDLHMSPVQKTLTNVVIAHETAHQWWGDTVMWSGYSDQWIMEALANYSSMMLLESRDPAQFRATMEKYRDDLLQKNLDGVPLMEAGPVTFGVRLSSSRFPNGYDAISYGRGTWLFHMLRYMMRDAEPKAGARPAGVAGADPADEPFIRVLRKVRERYQRKSISTRELLHAFEEELPPSLRYEGRKSLDWFYQGWVNGTAIPHIALEGIKYSDRSGSTAISGTMLQKFAPDDLVTSVPVYALLSGRTLLLGRVFADGAETQFHLTAPLGTRRVVVDPKRTLLRRAH